jgi:hypothetical protein
MQYLNEYYKVYNFLIKHPAGNKFRSVISYSKDAAYKMIFELAGCTYDDVEYINSQGIYIKLKGEYNATY